MCGSQRPHSHACQITEVIKKKLLGTSSSKFIGPRIKQKPAKWRRGLLLRRRFRMLNLGCAKNRYLAGSLALRNQLRRGAMQSSKGRMIKPAKTRNRLHANSGV